MKRIHSLCGFFWLLFSMITCWQASRLKLGSIHEPGPGFFPFSIGIVIGILSLIALFQSMREKKSSALPQPQELFRWWNIVVILGALMAYTLSLEKIGFLIDTFLFMLLLLKVVEPQTWKRAILGGLITAIACDLAFNVILRAQIPSGILGF